MNFRDIAKQTGVSIATISRVYNGKSGVGKNTRLIIEKALADNYHKEKNKTTKKPKTGQMLTFFIYEGKNHVIERNEDFFTGTLMGAERSLNELGYLLNIVRVNENNIFKILDKIVVDGQSMGILLFATELSNKQCCLLEKYKIPIVTLDNCMEYYSLNSVCSDNEFGTFKALEYLKKLGHTEIGLLAPYSPMGGLGKREKGFYESMNMLGMKVNEKYVVKLDHVFDVGKVQMDRWLAKGPKLPTAFYGVNDQIAAAAMKSLKEHGISIPKDISIVGFDDANIGDFVNPRITTMRVDCLKMGEIAVNRLMQMIEGDSSVLHIELETPLVIKDSTMKKE